MAQQLLSTEPVDYLRGSIDPRLTDAQRINAMFSELYAALEGLSAEAVQNQIAAAVQAQLAEVLQDHILVPAPPASGKHQLFAEDGLLVWKSTK